VGKLIVLLFAGIASLSFGMRTQGVGSIIQVRGFFSHGSRLISSLLLTVLRSALSDGPAYCPYCNMSRAAVFACLDIFAVLEAAFFP